MQYTVYLSFQLEQMKLEQNKTDNEHKFQPTCTSSFDTFLPLYDYEGELQQRLVCNTGWIKGQAVSVYLSASDMMAC